MSNFWIFLMICGAIISIAQKNQARQRRKAHTNEPSGEDAKTDRAELERQIREIFGETSPQGGDSVPKQSRVSPQPHMQSVTTMVKPQKEVLKNAPRKSKQAKTATPIPAAKTQHQPLKSTSEPNDTPIEAIIDDFSMEKAVIYSEIIRPKWEEY